MSNTGIFFALGFLEMSAMEARVSAGEQREWVESAYLGNNSKVLTVDVAWDAVHRCLGDGSLDEQPEKYPLQAVVLGGKHLGQDTGMLMRLNSPSTVHELAPEIMGIDETAFRSCYFRISADSYLMEPNETDFQYTWTYFQQIQSFYGRAAEMGEAVLFIAYQ